MCDFVANNDEERPKLIGGCTGKGFMPGQSGNPSGRPKAIQRLRGMLDPNLEKVVAGLIADALAGDKDARREFLDRLLGKPTVGMPEDDGKQSVTVRRIITGVIEADDLEPKS